jgi:hypothetical protein
LHSRALAQQEECEWGCDPEVSLVFNGPYLPGVPPELPPGATSLDIIIEYQPTGFHCTLHAAELTCSGRCGVTYSASAEYKDANGNVHTLEGVDVTTIKYTNTGRPLPVEHNETPYDAGVSFECGHSAEPATPRVSIIVGNSRLTFDVKCEQCVRELGPS